MKKHQLQVVPRQSRGWTDRRAGRWVGALDRECLKARVRALAGRIVRLAERLPMTGAAGLCGDELLLSAGTLTVTCQAALRATSGEELLGKLKLVQEEACECEAWLELLLYAEIVAPSRAGALLREADELVDAAGWIMRSVRGNGRVKRRLQDCEVRYLRLRR